jgi:hypothetical protein
MLTFRRTFIEDILIKETGKILKNCKLYVISNDTKIAGRFYSGDNFSFIESEEQKIRIDSNRHFFKPSIYHFYEQYNNSFLGRFEIPNDNGFGQGKLHIAEGETYQWIENRDHRWILNASTWNLYRFDLISVSHNIVYYGKMTPGVGNQICPEQIFEGEIQSTNDTLLLPILVGIYIMEEKFRRIEQDPG